MNKLTNPIEESIKETMVEKLYYRWDKENVLRHILTRYEIDPTEEKKLLMIINAVEKEVTKLRLKVGRIN